MPVPIIDLHHAESLCAAQIDDACRNVGFFMITNHDVPGDVVRNAWSATEEFFDQALDQKMTARHRDPDHPYGYFPSGQEALAASLGMVTPPDLKESFNLAPPADHEDPTGTFGGVQRIWPGEPERLRAAWTRYYDAMAALSERLLRLFATALDTDRSVFMDAVNQHLSALRGLNYPALSVPPEAGQLRAGEHTDYGTLTILLPGPGSGGLEVQRTDGTWDAVQPLGDAFVVNLGDMMAQWTNDRWRSTRHRVAVPATDRAGTERRQSMAFFHQPNWDAEIAVLESCVSPEHPARYQPVVAGPWLMNKFTAAST